MEEAVRLDGRAAAHDLAAHVLQQAAKPRQRLVVDVRAGQHDDRAFERCARLHQLGRTFTERRRLAGGPLGRRGHVDARPAADLDAAFHVERDERFAQRGARHAELLREVALGRQPRADVEPALLDQFANLVGDLLIEPTRLDLF